MKLKINAPSIGISQSPHIGYGDIRNMDIDSVPGIAKLNTILSKVSGTTVDAQVKWIARDPDTPANICALDSNGVLYKSTNSGATWSEISDRGGSGQGLIIKWGYAFICEDTTIDVMKMSDNTFTDNWQTIDSDTVWHPMIASVNEDAIFGGAGRYIFSIKQETTFDPTSSATYTFTQQDLSLPAGKKVKCLAELGNNLMCGTWEGSAINQIRKATIFPWDGSSPTYGQPIEIDEFGVHAMINTGNILTVLAGVEGVVYRCDGANAYPIARLPQDLSGGKYIEYYPGSIMNFKRKVFFGTGIVTSAGLLSGMGVYSVARAPKGTILNLEHLISTLRDGTADEVQCSALLPVTQNTCLVGWRDDDDATGFGIDLSSATSYAYGTTYSGHFDSPLYEVGNHLNKFRPSAIEIHLGRPLRTGEGIQIAYRDGLDDSFTTVKTMAFADNKVGAMTSRIITLNITDRIKECEQIQFRVALLGTTTTTPEFLYMLVQ